MPIESKSAIAIHTSSRAAANSDSSSGVSRQAVQQPKVPVEKQDEGNGPAQMYDGGRKTPGPFELKRNNAASPAQRLSHEAWQVVQQKQGSVSPIVTSASPAQPVVQRALKTKEDIFMDQVKFHVMKGIYHYDTDDAEENQYYVDALAKFNLIDKKALIARSKVNHPKNKRITQDAFYLQEKGTGMSGVTFTALQNNGLLMDGIRLTEDEASWDQYKSPFASSRKKDKEKKVANAEGVGGKTSLQADVKTKIQWEPVNSSGEGKKVTALVLGPDHPLGTTPSKATKTKAAKLQKATGRGYIAGHLLNDHLGGPGNDKRNIAAIPKDVNTEQSDKIEERVKSRVNSLHEVVFYQVEVTYSKDKKTEYASNLKSSFGTYKEGTDFNDPKFSNFNSIPKTDLEDFYEHNLPIQSPSSYKSTGDGYESASDKLYASGGSRDPAANLTGLTPSGKKATYDVDVRSHILLKDAKQIKLEFISYAIYSMPIKELNERIEHLAKQGAYKDKLLREGATEINKKEDEVAYLQGESVYKDRLLREGATEISKKEEEIAYQQKDGTYKDKLLSEGAAEISKKEEEIAYQQKDGTYKDKLLSEGAAEINKLEGDIEKNNELLERLFLGLNKIRREIAADRKSPDIELSDIDKVDMTRLEERLGVVLNDAKKQRIEIEKLKEELDITRKKLAGVEIERDNYKHLNRRHIGGYGFESAFKDKRSPELKEPRSPTSSILFEEGLTRGRKHREEVDQLRDEKEYYRGFTTASRFQDHASKLGWGHAQDTDRMPDNIGSVLSDNLSWLNKAWDSHAYDEGFSDGLRNLVPSYVSGFKSGMQDREIRRLRQEQQHLLSINLQGRRGDNDQRRNSGGYPPPRRSNYPPQEDQGFSVTSMVDSYRTPTAYSGQSRSNHNHLIHLDPDRGRRSLEGDSRSHRRYNDDEKKRREDGGNRSGKTESRSSRRKSRSPERKKSSHSLSGTGGRGDHRDKDGRRKEDRPSTSGSFSGNGSKHDTYERHSSLRDPRDRQREERKQDHLPLKKRPLPQETDRQQRDRGTDRPRTDERERKRSRHHSPRQRPPQQHDQNEGNRDGQRGLPSQYQHGQYDRHDQGYNHDDWFNRNDRKDL